MSKVQTISVIAFLSFCMIVGSLVFSRGFLLNRQIVHETAGPCLHSSRAIHIKGNEKVVTRSEPDNGLSSMSNWCHPTPPFPKLILILVDALRFDFVQRMKFLSSVVDSSQATGVTSCNFKFVADPPTTTMQRLKALMTGTMPTFIDASANFNSYEIEEDSLIYQLFSIGKRIAFLGDDTWLSLFPKKYFKSKFVEAHPSFNAWDLDTVDKAVNKTLQDIFLHPNKEDWDVLITHILGVDHCGHRYGPNHPEMRRKLFEADSIIQHVFNSMSNDTLLVIFGDHGMTSTGDHGGDSKDEVESAVIFLSKQLPKYNPPFQCFKNLSISQIDLVPTLAPLLGIPIPYSNIGQTIPAFLQNKINSDAIAANVAQVNKYIQHFPTMLLSSNEENDSETGNLVQQYKRIEEAFKMYQSSPNITSRDRLQELSEKYLKQVKAVAVSTWTQFNLPMIYTGVVITLLSVVSLFVYLTSMSLFSKRRLPIKYSVLSWLWPSLSHWSVLCTFVYHSISSTGFAGIIVSTLSGVFVFLVLLLIRISQKHKLILRRISFSYVLDNLSGFLSMILYTFTCLAVFSNSFTVNEGYVLGFTLTSVVLIEVASLTWTKPHCHEDFTPTISMCQDNPLHVIIIKKLLKCSWSCFITLAALLRVSHVFFRCREEQTTCTEEFLLHKQLSSLPEDWLVHKYLRYGSALLVLAIFIVSLRHWMIHRSCNFSRKPRAMIARFVPSVLVVLLGVFWALQGLPYISSCVSKIPLLMNYLPLFYQVVNVFSIIVVSFNPICCIGHLKHAPYKNSTKSQPTSTATFTNDSRRIPESKMNKTDSVIMANGKQGQFNGIVNNSGNQNFLKEKQQTKITFPYPSGGRGQHLCDCFSEDTYSSSFLTLASLVTLQLVQVTSTGIAPAIIIQIYALICLVGIFRKSVVKDAGSWSSAVAWTLTSQYFFYATGHQPIFSAIPWDSAFVGGGDGSGLASNSGAWITWLRAGLAVIGNLHVSQILSSLTLPLLVYWSVDKRKAESVMGKNERHTAYTLYGKYLALHGLKLLMCMCCSGWHRRHLMVWKIFAPKFIFEAISFIVTSSTSLLGMVFLSRINYCHQKYLDTRRTV